MISRFQPSRVITPVILFLLLIAISYWLNPEPWRHLDRASKALFAGSAIVLAALAWGIGHRMYLRIDERGLEIRYAVGAPRVYAWSDIESAHIFRASFLHIPMTSSIHLRLRPELRSVNPVLRAAAAVNRADASIPAFFEESAEDILEKIEFFKRESRNASPGASGSISTGPTYLF